MLFMVKFASMCRVQRHLAMYSGFRLPIVLCIVLQPFPILSAYAQQAKSIDTSRAEIRAVCERPFPPSPEHYENATDFNAAREAYYMDASVYVSDCIDSWVLEARQRYEEMFRMEAYAYQQDRQSVMDEMRDAAHLKY